MWPSVFQVLNLIIKIRQLSITCAFVVLSWACSNNLFIWKSPFTHSTWTRQCVLRYMHAIIIKFNSFLECLKQTDFRIQSSSSLFFRFGSCLDFNVIIGFFFFSLFFILRCDVIKKLYVQWTIKNRHTMMMMALFFFSPFLLFFYLMRS